MLNETGEATPPRPGQGAEYRYADGGLNSSHAYLIPAVLDALTPISPKRLFDLGRGNGSVAAQLAGAGWDVTGVDPSEEGIAQAHSAFPKLKLKQHSAYDDLAVEFGRFPAVVCMEVIEHVYDPRRLLRTAHGLLEEGGKLIITTPYHGYLKNLLLAATGRMEHHFDVTTDNGHIKFFSARTLRTLLSEAGFRQVETRHAGRIPPLAKSMLMIATR